MKFGDWIQIKASGSKGYVSSWNFVPTNAKLINDHQCVPLWFVVIPVIENENGREIRIGDVLLKNSDSIQFVGNQKFALFAPLTS